MTQTLTLLLVFLLVFDRILHYAKSYSKKDALTFRKSFWYWIRFWKPLRAWVWTKIPITPIEIRQEFRTQAIQKVIDTPDKSEILNYELPLFYKKIGWSSEEIEMEKKKEKLNIQFRAEERRLFIQDKIKRHPWTYLLFKTKFLT